MRSIVLTVLLLAGSASADVLVNGDFEQGLEGWSVTIAGQGAAVWPSSEAFQGSGSAAVMTYGAQLPGHAAISQDATLPGAGRYCLSLAVQAAGDGGFSAVVTEAGVTVLDVLLYGAPSEWISSRSCFETTAKHAQVTVTLSASPGATSGGGYLDSVSLSELAP